MPPVRRAYLGVTDPSATAWSRAHAPLAEEGGEVVMPEAGAETQRHGVLESAHYTETVVSAAGTDAKIQCDVRTRRYYAALRTDRARR